MTANSVSENTTSETTSFRSVNQKSNDISVIKLSERCLVELFSKSIFLRVLCGSQRIWRLTHYQKTW